MNKKVALVVLSVILICMYVNCQDVQKSDPGIKYEKAKYLKEDLTRFLLNNTKYPYNEMVNRVNGDVVFSFIVNKNASLENLAIYDYSNISMVKSSMNSMNSLTGEWKPAFLNDLPVDKKYFIVFRFRTFMDSNPLDYKGQGKNFFVRQKYEKALKSFDSGIKDNKYDYELFELRSLVKDALGDSEGAKNDLAVSSKLKDEIMTVINVVVAGYTKTIRIESLSTSTRINQ